MIRRYSLLFDCMLFHSQTAGAESVHAEGADHRLRRLHPRGHHGRGQEGAAGQLTAAAATALLLLLLQVLEGHRNNVSCLARAHSGSYIASGDIGPDIHSVFVWSVIIFYYITI